MAHPATPPLTLLLLLLVALTGSAYQDSGEEGSNDFQDIDTEKRASNLGNRFNLGKKFIGYQWLRSMESRQRRTPYYLAHFRPQESSRNNEMYWMKSFRY